MHALLQNTLVDRAEGDDDACMTCLDNDEAVERHDQHSEHCHDGNNDFLGVHFEIDFLLLGIHYCFSFIC